jgi:hypothetical protein
MGYITQKDYYTNNGVSPTNQNWGEYQRVGLFDIVNNFMLMYYGNNNLTNNTEKFKVIWHAKRCVQELAYDASNTPLSLQLTVGEDLKFILPPDYVNIIKISLYKNNTVRQLTENIQITTATQYQQDTDGNVEFYGDDVILVDPSEIDGNRLNGVLKTMYIDTNNPTNSLNNQWGWYIDGFWYFSRGARFGLNTETANCNPTYQINRAAGVINFSSNMSGESCILEYVSDGMQQGNDELIYVNKMFEAYVYAYIEYEIMSSKLGTTEYVIRRLQKKKSSLLTNAKIRMSNIKPQLLLMALRSQEKWIK